MALKFKDLPGTTRGVQAEPALTSDEVAELKANPGKWAVVAEGITNTAKYATFAKDAGLEYATRTNKTEEYTNRNGKPATKRYVDVYMSAKKK